MASSSSQSPVSPFDDQVNDKTPIRTKRRYGASCELCRRRKRKCPGRDSKGNSLCTHCGEVGVKCVFPPRNGSFIRAKKAVSVAPNAPEETENLRAYIRRLASASEEDRERMLHQWINENDGSSVHAVQAFSSKFKPRSPGKSSNLPFELSDDDGLPMESPHMPSSPPNLRTDPRPPKKAKLWNGRTDKVPSVPENVGEEEEETQNTALRPESALRLSLKPATPDSDLSHGEGQEEQSAYNRFMPHTDISKWVDHYTERVFRMDTEADGSLVNEREVLFNNYFCWQGPRNYIVDKAIFERAMQENDSKYYSQFLMYTICAHTVRHVPQVANRAHMYAAKAHFLLASELSRPSSIPTAQGLLLLASHHASRGMYAQAWNLTAAAIAMMKDLGCQLETKIDCATNSDTAQQRKRNSVQRRMRLRLFWSAFIWDKLISLALNRKPLLSLEDHKPPFPEPNDSSELWVPCLSADSPPALFSYVPQLSHQDKCFYETCRANQFLDEIHRHIYCRPKMRPSQVCDFVSNMRERLLKWQAGAYQEVIFEIDGCPLNPPPPHIMQLNLLVRAMWILLYRPFFYSSARSESSAPSSVPAPSVPHAVSTCERAAKDIHVLFTMYDRLYPLSRASYIVVFAAFLAATVDLALADREKSVSGLILTRLALAGKVLSGGSSNIPGMHSSVLCLQKHLHATLSRCNSRIHPTTHGRSHSTTSSTPSSSAISSNVAALRPDDSYTVSSPTSHQRSSSSPVAGYAESSSQSQSSTVTGTPSPPVAEGAPLDSSLPLQYSPLSTLPQQGYTSTSNLSHPANLPPSVAAVDSTSHHSSSPAIPSEDGTSSSNLYPTSSQHRYTDVPYQLSQNSYVHLSTPENDMMEYMVGSQFSHYEGGWNPWFWPGDTNNPDLYSPLSSATA